MTHRSPVHQEKSPPRVNLGRAIVAELKRLDSKACKACGTQFPPPTYLSKYCDNCRKPAPGVYRFVCPDGRSYVGSTRWLKTRPVFGLSRRNLLITAAADGYPLETWTFEALECLPAECSEQELREAEQRHIERLGTLDPSRGFNVTPAAPAGCRSQHQTARDYGVSTYALKRWAKLLGFPTRITFGRKHYYRIAELAEWDRQWASLTREEIARKVHGRGRQVEAPAA
jgi:hypothetical protein